MQKFAWHLTRTDGPVIIKFMSRQVLRRRRQRLIGRWRMPSKKVNLQTQAITILWEKGETMKSVGAVGRRKGHRGNIDMRLLTCVMVLIISALALAGCRYPVKAVSWVDHKIDDLIYLGEGEEFAYPGETEAEVRRRHERVSQLNGQRAWSSPVWFG